MIQLRTYAAESDVKNSDYVGIRDFSVGFVKAVGPAPAHYYFNVVLRHSIKIEDGAFRVLDMSQISRKELEQLQAKINNLLNTTPPAPDTELTRIS